MSVGQQAQRQSGPRSPACRLARAALNLITAARGGYIVTTTRPATGYTIVSYRHCVTRAGAAWRRRRAGATTVITRGSLPPDLQPGLGGEADRDSRVLIGGNAGCRSLAASSGVSPKCRGRRVVCCQPSPSRVPSRGEAPFIVLT
jgi:hypothetical protein